VDSFLPESDQSQPDISHLLGIERPPVDVGGTEGVVRVFEEVAGAESSDRVSVNRASAPPKVADEVPKVSDHHALDRTPEASGSDNPEQASDRVSVNRASAPPKVADEIPKLNDYFTFQRKSEASGSDSSEAAVVWTHHYEGVDIPEEQFTQDLLTRLKGWLKRFVAESEARQAKKKEEQAMRRVAARVARLEREKERDVQKKRLQEEQRRVEEEAAKIEADTRKKKEELEKATAIAKAAKRKQEEEHEAIIADLKRLKREQVRSCFCKSFFDQALVPSFDIILGPGCYCQMDCQQEGSRGTATNRSVAPERAK
jgi:hypothetical protein